MQVRYLLEGDRRVELSGEGPRPGRAGGAPQLPCNDRCFSAERSVSWRRVTGASCGMSGEGPWVPGRLHCVRTGLNGAMVL